MSAGPSEARRAIRRLNLAGFAAILLLVAGVGGWAATTELSGAVIAPGSLVVESNIKKVQHPTGGVVGALNVSEGSAVDAGDVLIVLDDTVPRATLGVVRAELDSQMLRAARLTAERDGAETVAFPEALAARKDEEEVAAAFAGEVRLFDARRTTLVGQRAQFREQVAQLAEQINGFEAQLRATEAEIALIDKELVGVNDLLDRKLVSLTKQTELERGKASLDGERGQLVASIAGARGRISEIELQILQLDKDFRTDVLNELRASEASISELEERETAAADQLRRIDIRAPQAGVVHELAVHTVGGVISAGETLMLIVPRADKLVVDAQVSPPDVDQVVIGSTVDIQIESGNRRVTPVVQGEVLRVSPDLKREQNTGRAYYVVRIVLSDSAHEKLGGLTLIPGMQAAVYVRTDKRTPLEYLLKPIEEQIARTFRER